MSAPNRRDALTPGKRPSRTRSKDDLTHVVKVPLRVTQRDALLIDQRLHLVGMLRNSTLRSLLDAADRLHASDAWQKARTIGDPKERGRVMRDLRYEAGLYKDGSNRIAHAHWKAGPYTDLLDSWSALAIGAEVWTSVERWLCAQAGRPRYARASDRETVWGNGIKNGLRVVDECLVWQSDRIRRAPKGTRLARKRLQIPLDYSALSRPRREHLRGCELRRVGIRRETIRGQVRYTALLCVAGAPYRNAEYLTSTTASRDGVVGLDMGVSQLGVATLQHAELVPLCDPALLEERKTAAQLERRRQRALDRSRRANNPDAFALDGQSIRGVRQTRKSRRGRQLEATLANTKRRAAEKRKQDRAKIAHAIRSKGGILAIEAADYRHWHRCELRWAKRLGLTSPGLMHEKLRWEARVTQGELREIDPWTNASSQRCLCGARVKKQLSQREHHCPECGLHAHRDLLPAFLACLLGETGLVMLDDLLPVAAQTLGAPPDLTGRGSRAGSSSRPPATGEATPEAGHRDASLGSVQTGSRAEDDSDPTTRQSLKGNERRGKANQHTRTSLPRTPAEGQPRPVGTSV